MVGGWGGWNIPPAKSYTDILLLTLNYTLKEQEEAVVVVVGSIDVPHEALGRVIYLLISN